MHTVLTVLHKKKRFRPPQEYDLWSLPLWHRIHPTLVLWYVRTDGRMRCTFCRFLIYDYPRVKSVSQSVGWRRRLWSLFLIRGKISEHSAFCCGQKSDFVSPAPAETETKRLRSDPIEQVETVVTQRVVVQRTKRILFQYAERVKFLFFRCGPELVENWRLFHVNFSGCCPIICQFKKNRLISG